MTTIYDNTFNHLFEGFIKFVSIRTILNDILRLSPRSITQLRDSLFSCLNSGGFKGFLPSPHQL